MHRYHPDLDDPYNDRADAILFDECEDCEAKAENPAYELDWNTVHKLWQRMYAVEYARADGYRSENEAHACKKLWHTWIFLRNYVGMSAEEARDILDRSVV